MLGKDAGARHTACPHLNLTLGDILITHFSSGITLLLCNWKVILLPAGVFRLKCSTRKENLGSPASRSRSFACRRRVIFVGLTLKL